jgi:hypothetical protein
MTSRRLSVRIQDVLFPPLGWAGGNDRGVCKLVVLASEQIGRDAG